MKCYIDVKIETQEISFDECLPTNRQLATESKLIGCESCILFLQKKVVVMMYMYLRLQPQVHYWK